ncbi:unnamed protein product [Cylicocyclus nassatus]|uniref:Uncharacterized protein n=1 Tax=Cylicocyclus nassatus TaxID=53992 RepID=A0AA36HEZ8_CYLNA|nr:unnamed protein product [Cylicocyclus nassatus]
MSDNQDYDCDNDIEIPRDDEYSCLQSLDTTLFFADLEMQECGDTLLKTPSGDTIRLNSSEEVDIDAYMAAHQSSLSPSDAASNASDFEDKEVEVPRGFSTDTDRFVNENSSQISPSIAQHSQKNESSVRKVEDFLENMKRDPAWARSIHYVKLNAMIPKDILLQLVRHAYTHVNERPQHMVVLSKYVNEDDITKCINMAFASTEAPLQKSLFRMYCKNSVSSLKSLIVSILAATSSNPDLEVGYNDVLGELNCSGSVRLRTPDVKTFCKLESLGKALGMRFVTTFNCRSKTDKCRIMDIRYYDEPRKDGSRVNYVHLDHEASNCRGITFSDVHSEMSFEVKGEMTPLHRMYPTVYDLNETIRKLHAQQQSK